MADSGKAAREELFVAVLNLVEQYLALQHSLGATLRSGFLNLSAGRYSMGADRVSSLQFPAHMHASSRVVVTGDGRLQLVQSEPPSPTAARKQASQPQPAAATPEPQAAPAPHASSASSAPAAEKGGVSLERVSTGLAGVRLGSGDASSILHELAAKYDCCLDEGDDAASGAESEGEAGAGEAAATHHAPTRPLHWFGALVAPQLRESEKNFAEGLELAVRAASVRQQLQARLAEYRALQLPPPTPEASSA